MRHFPLLGGSALLLLAGALPAAAQKPELVRVAKSATGKKVDVFVGKELFTSFLYPDTLEKPVRYPLRAANGTTVSRFAANPLGEQAFTNGASAKNRQLKKGESVTFRYRVLMEEGRQALSARQLNEAATDFAKKTLALAKTPQGGRRTRERLPGPGAELKLKI